jgi:hypothetical protein
MRGVQRAPPATNGCAQFCFPISIPFTNTRISEIPGIAPGILPLEILPLEHPCQLADWEALLEEARPAQVLGIRRPTAVIRTEPRTGALLLLRLTGTLRHPELIAAMVLDNGKMESISPRSEFLAWKRSFTATPLILQSSTPE